MNTLSALSDLLAIAFLLSAGAVGWVLWGRMAAAMQITRLQLLALIVFFGWLWN